MQFTQSSNYVYQSLRFLNKKRFVNEIHTFDSSIIHNNSHIMSLRHLCWRKWFQLKWRHHFDNMVNVWRGTQALCCATIKRKQTKALHALNSQVSDDELSRNDISFREHPLSADPNIANLRRQNRRIYLQMWGPASI